MDTRLTRRGRQELDRPRLWFELAVLVLEPERDLRIIDVLGTGDPQEAEARVVQLAEHAMGECEDTRARRRHPSRVYGMWEEQHGVYTPVYHIIGCQQCSVCMPSEQIVRDENLPLLEGKTDWETLCLFARTRCTSQMMLERLPRDMLCVLVPHHTYVESSRPPQKVVPVHGASDAYWACYSDQEMVTTVTWSSGSNLKRYSMLEARRQGDQWYIEYREGPEGSHSRELLRTFLKAVGDRWGNRATNFQMPFFNPFFVRTTLGISTGVEIRDPASLQTLDTTHWLLTYDSVADSGQECVLTMPRGLLPHGEDDEER